VDNLLYSVCIPMESIGGIYSVPRAVPQLGGDVDYEKTAGRP
jgi:hypothetical protein